MVSSTPCPAVHILGSQNVYGRAEGIADHYWPWAVFYLNILGFMAQGCFVAFLGCFLGQQGGTWGFPSLVSLYPLTRLPLRHFTTKYEPSISKTLGFSDQGCFGLLRAVFGCFWDPQGGTWGCVRSASLYFMAHSPLSGFATKIQPSIKKTSLFYELGLFGAVWGYFRLFLGALGRHMGLSQVNQPLPCNSHSFKAHYYKI